MWSREKLNRRQNHHIWAAKPVLQFSLYSVRPGEACLSAQTPSLGLPFLNHVYFSNWKVGLFVSGSLHGLT